MAISDNGNTVPVQATGRRTSFRASDPTRNAFFWLSAFFVVYCARPEDWIPGLKYLPLAKLTAILALWGLFSAWGKTKRTFKDLPKEAKLLLAMTGLLYVGAFFSPIWRGGALSRTIDFSKIYIAWVLIFLLITTFDRLRRIIFIQIICVVAVCAVALVKGHGTPRLEGVLGGIYTNPNDLAFAIVLSLPFALAFMVTARNAAIKALWFCGMLVMAVAIFRTASRGGFIDLVIAGSVTLYYFAIKGKRLYLLVATALLGTVVMGAFGGKLYDRFSALSGDSATDQSAYGSYEDRKYLALRAIDAIEHYPILGLGVRNFSTYSLIWHDVHMTYLQICCEGGIAVLILYLMFFYRGFKNLKTLRQTKNLDPDIVLFVAALQSSLIGFVVGACFAPEAYQYFPYFAVAFTATLLQIVKEREQGPGPALPPPKKPRHFLEVYADRGTAGAVSPGSLTDSYQGIARAMPLGQDIEKRMRLGKQLAYARKIMLSATWRALKTPARGRVHVILALADHFEPSIVPEDGQKRAPRPEQERRLEWWAREYPKVVDGWRDHDGRPLVHTYFYPAEQYDEGLLDMLASHCHAGWGEVEIHLHHGIPDPDTAENTRQLLGEFRDRLAFRHGCLAREEGSSRPRYAFVHGNFALANSAGGRFCGVDSEMQILAETGCYADMTLPAAYWDPAQTEKINSLYECALPLDHAMPHRQGHDLVAGRAPKTFPLIVQGPLVTDLRRTLRSARPAFDNGALTAAKPATMNRFSLWKQAQVRVLGRPDWLFIKLHCHSMDPTQKDTVIGDSFRQFLAALVGGAGGGKETLHFVAAREMTNILLAACDGRDGNPGDYRDYRFQRFADARPLAEKSSSIPVASKG